MDVSLEPICPISKACGLIPVVWKTWPGTLCSQLTLLLRGNGIKDNASTEHRIDVELVQ